MAIFFFLVGLEIKRELLRASCRRAQQAALPAIAALGGMVGAGADLRRHQRGDPVALRGWAIPAATDIAFAVGVLALLGPRVPTVAQGVPAGARHHRRSRRHPHHRASSTRPSCRCSSLLLAGAGIAVLVVLNRRGVTRHRALRALGLVHLGVRAEVGRARDAGRRRHGARHPAAPSAGTSEIAAAAAGGEPASVGHVRRAAAVRLRQCRRLASPA